MTKGKKFKRKIRALAASQNLSYQAALQLPLPFPEGDPLPALGVKGRVLGRVSPFHCPECGGTMYLRTGRFGPFYGCVGYPACGTTQSADEVTGDPVGPLADQETKRLRRQLYQELQDLPPTVRDYAYAELTQRCGTSKIGSLNKRQLRDALQRAAPIPLRPGARPWGIVTPDPGEDFRGPDKPVKFKIGKLNPPYRARPPGPVKKDTVRPGEQRVRIRGKEIGKIWCEPAPVEGEWVWKVEPKAKKRKSYQTKDAALASLKTRFG